VHGPALAVLETSLIARGLVVVDAALKRAEVEIVASRVVSGGAHLAILAGPVEPVVEAFAAGVAAAGDALADRVILPYAHPQLGPLLGPPVHPVRWDGADRHAAAIVETTTVSAAVRAIDAACKAADVVVRDARLAVGIGGKAFFSLTGELHDVEAAAAAAREAAGDRLACLEIIAAPAGELAGRLVFG
jgi:microcompartment protein CcmL/EutN